MRQQLLNAYWDTIISNNDISLLKSEHFLIVDDFLPLIHDSSSSPQIHNYYESIQNMSERNQLMKEESYMDDEASGQVEKIGEHPFYTLKMNKKEHEQSSVEEHCQLYSLTTQIGQYFQSILFNEIVKRPLDEPLDVEFFNKVALCKDFENGLPLHLDNCNQDTRKITIVYYTTPFANNQEERKEMELKYPGIKFEERNWQGGLLRVYKPSTKLYINYWETEKIDIEPKFNRAVIFFSDTIVHTVTETKPLSHSNEHPTRPEMHPPRTTITTWVHCNDMSQICRDKVLFQRQMIKFFQ